MNKLRRVAELALNLKRKWLTLCIAVVLVFSVHTQTYANNSPEISPSLKKLLAGLPIADMKDELQGMLVELRKTSCGNNLKGCYMTQSGPLQLYFFTSGQSQQTLLLVVDKKMAMPRLLGEKVQKVMGETSLSAPIISISTTDFDLDNIKMPPPLQKVVRENYFNINTLSFSSGVQVAARTNLGGPIKLTMEAFGVKANQVMMRAAVVMPMPADLTGSAGADMAHGNTMKQAGADAVSPEAFVEFQFAPNAKIPLTMPKVTLTDATFFINNALTFGYKGNAAFSGAENKKIIMHFQTPLNPAGGMDLLDFAFRMATPASFTMEDAAHMMVAMATPDPRLLKYGGGFIRNINAFKEPLMMMTKPLSVVQLQNPTPPPPYRFGDSSKPFPEDNKYYNFVLLGPLAQGGPLMHGAGDVTILGQRMGWLYATAGQSGLTGDTGRALTLKLGPLGKVSFHMQATTAINADKQEITLLGNFSGQKVEVGMSGNTMKVAVNATCVNPFEIKTQVEIKPDTDLARVFEGQGGVNVDPSKISGCIGKELEAAYKKIAGEFSHLGGYSASAANAELKKISDAAAEVARKEYEKAKDEARELASRSTSAANKAFNDAGNVFKGIGKKKKHKSKPDARLDRSIFNWDYYYDHNPDVVKSGMDLVTHWLNHGYHEGRQGSLEFNAKWYLANYPDLQRNLGDYDGAVWHWVEGHGPREGRQASPDFSVRDYLARYPDLQRAFGNQNYEAAYDHWIEHGKAEGRNGRP